MTADFHDKSNWLALKITPRASQNEIIGFTDGVLHVKIAAPPVKDKANKELTDFLSKSLGVRKSAIFIVKGQKSRNKIIAIEGITRDEIIKRFSL